MAKTLPEEIQQMQDNIHWIKGAQESKLVWVLKPESCNTDAEGRVKVKLLNYMVK
jgi:urocanate hydratase